MLSGTYTLRLHIGDRILEQSLVVKKDPRARWTDDEYLARQAFMRRELGQLDQIDKILNDFDARAGKQPLTPDERAVYDALTSSPRNSEDSLDKPNRIRESLGTLLTDLSLSEGPPTSGHVAEAGRITAALDAALAAYNALPKSR